MIGLSRVRARTKTRFLINEGETRTLFRERGLEVVGIEEEPVCVMGER